jgi:hypothetical protein
MTVEDAPPTPAVVTEWAAPAVPVRRGRPSWPALAVGALVVGGIALRFVSVGPLWLDEAQSVSIASEPLRLLPHALRVDGAPPLWYALLHLWMRAFGDSTYSVRLTGVIPALLALPVMERLGRRIGGRAVGVTSLVLLATSPFAIRYAVETRMYSLTLLLSLLAAHALLSVHRSRSPWPVVALAVLTAMLLYTHYYAIWLGLVVGGGELWRATRHRDRRSWWAVAAIGAGGLAFVPWLPVLLFQARHTGAPWAAPPSVTAVLGTVGSWLGGTSPVPQLAQLVVLALILLAVLGRRSARRTVVLGLPAAPGPLRLLGVVVGVVLVAVLDAMLTKQAYAPRYTSVVLGLFVVLVAIGVQVLPSQRSRQVVVAGLAVMGLAVGANTVARPRTQAASVATELRAASEPGDVVVYCPDQLGPSTSRLLPASLRLHQVVYPTLGPPQRVDWVDYAKRQALGNPTDVAGAVNRLSDGHTIWLVWSSKYHATGTECTQLIAALTLLRGQPYPAVVHDSGDAESMAVEAFDTPSDAF